jgi:hypothetical protein
MVSFASSLRDVGVRASDSSSHPIDVGVRVPNVTPLSVEDVGTMVVPDGEVMSMVGVKDVDV